MTKCFAFFVVSIFSFQLLAVYDPAKLQNMESANLELIVSDSQDRQESIRVNRTRLKRNGFLAAQIAQAPEADAISITRVNIEVFKRLLYFALFRDNDIRSDRLLTNPENKKEWDKLRDEYGPPMVHVANGWGQTPERLLALIVEFDDFSFAQIARMRRISPYWNRFLSPPAVDPEQGSAKYIFIQHLFRNKDLHPKANISQAQIYRRMMAAAKDASDVRRQLASGDWKRPRVQQFIGSLDQLQAWFDAPIAGIQFNRALFEVFSQESSSTRPFRPLSSDRDSDKVLALAQNFLRYAHNDPSLVTLSPKTGATADSIGRIFHKWSGSPQLATGRMAVNRQLQAILPGVQDTHFYPLSNAYDIPNGVPGPDAVGTCGLGNFVAALIMSPAYLVDATANAIVGVGSMQEDHAFYPAANGMFGEVAIVLVLVASKTSEIPGVIIGGLIGAGNELRHLRWNCENVIEAAETGADVFSTIVDYGLGVPTSMCLGLLHAGTLGFKGVSAGVAVCTSAIVNGITRAFCGCPRRVDRVRY